MRNKDARVSDPNEFVTCSGSPDKIIYKTKVLPDGTLDIQPSGKESIQAKIESFRPNTDMAYIIKQMQLGNYEVLNGASGSYGDFTKMPKTMAEAMQLRIDAEDAWYKLPVDTRAKFDHDLNKWLATAGTKEWSDIMMPAKPVDEHVSEKKTKSDVIEKATKSAVIEKATKSDVIEKATKSDVSEPN